MIFRTMATFIQLKTIKTLDKFKKFKAEVENQHDLKIKIVRSDWGVLQSTYVGDMERRPQGDPLQSSTSRMGPLLVS
jgi:hypothetical protein